MAKQYKAVREQVKEVMDAAQKDLNKGFRLLVMEGFRRVVMRSPVDKGTFRGNWVVAVGVRNNSFDLTKTDSGTRGTAPSAVQMNQALATTARLETKAEKTYISNNLPYADPLENGSSTQAPNGMVHVTALELTGAARQIVRSARK